MEAKLFTQTRRFIIPFPRQNLNPQRAGGGSSVLAVLTRPSVQENISGLEAHKKGSKAMDGIDGSTRKTVYNDSWFDRVAVDHLSNNVQAVTGLRNDKIGYESLMQAATDASKTFDAIKQRELVLESLKRAIPVPMLNLIKILLPQSRFKREYFATFTTMFFAWLVGPCEVRESDFDGRKEKNAVHIKKCRFLEEANCVGMCTNLCKVPSQVFIKETMGMPVNMVPNFDDMSCEMIFGQDPPPLNEDPALKQPCYKLCKSKKNHKMECAA